MGALEQLLLNTLVEREEYVKNLELHAANDKESIKKQRKMVTDSRGKAEALEKELAAVKEKLISQGTEEEKGVLEELRRQVSALTADKNTLEGKLNNVMDKLGKEQVQVKRLQEQNEV